MVAMVAFVMAALTPAALAQEAKVSDDVWAKKGEAKAGGASAKTEPCPEAKAGDVVAKGKCPPPPPPKPAPAPKAAPPPPPKAEAKAAPPPKAEQKKQLPKTGGVPGSVSLFALGAGALLVGSGLLVRRITR
jgi:LPXTG-motif cell wall-anchored protein